MRVLLDTHAYLWFLAGDERLSLRGRRLIADPDADLLLSAASLWEIAIKHSIGRLPLARPFVDMFPEQLDQDRVRLLAIAPEHLHQLVQLPQHHRDPFDRLILAQALTEGVPVLTRDAAFADYSAQLIWE